MDNLEILVCLRKISSVLDRSETLLSQGQTECFDDIVGAVEEFAGLIKKENSKFSSYEASQPDIYRELMQLTDSIKEKITRLNGKIEIWKERQLQLIGQSRKSANTLGKYSNSPVETSFYLDREAD